MPILPSDPHGSPAETVYSSLVPESAHGWRLDKTLGLILPEAEWGLRARRRLCDRRLVLVNGKIGTPGTKVRAGQEVLFLADPDVPVSSADSAGFVNFTNSTNSADTADSANSTDTGTSASDTPKRPVAPSEQSAQPYVVAHDAELVALFKPAGLHTVALTGSLAPNLEAFLPALLAPFLHASESDPESHPVLLNRLDAPTSGLVLAALAPEGERRWRRAERLGYTDKLYLAIIEGQPLYDFSVCRRLDTDSRIRTRVRSTDDPDPLRHTDVTLLHAFTLADAPGLAPLSEQDTPVPLMLVQCRIRKGARHQIRAHLAAAGHPLFGDVLYGGTLHPAKPASDDVVLSASEAARQSRFFLHHEHVVLPDFEAACRAPWLDLLPEQARRAFSVRKNAVSI